MQENYSAIKTSNRYTVKSQNTVECKISEAESIKKLLCVNAAAIATDVGCADGEIKYAGRVTYNVVYENNEGKICATECGVEFSSRLEESKSRSGADALIKLRLLKTDIDSETKKTVISSIVEAEICLNTEQEVKYLSSGENLIVNPGKAEYQKFEKIKLQTFETEEEFEVRYCVKNVIMHSAGVAVEEVQSSVGAATVSGSVLLLTTSITDGEKTSFVNENRAIPFKFELAAENIMPNMAVKVYAEVEKTNIKVVVDEENGTSVITATVILAFRGEYIENISIDFAEDVYSPSNDLESVPEKFVQNRYVRQYTLKERVFNSCEFEISENEKILGCLNCFAADVALNSDKTAVEGLITMEFLISDEQAVRSEKAVVPFSAPVNTDSAHDYEVQCCVEDFAYRRRSELEAEATLRISLIEYENNAFTFISQVTVGAEKTVNNSAISVYYAKQNDLLWDVSKALGVCGDIIMKYNTDLQFPLKGDERVIVFRSI